MKCRHVAGFFPLVAVARGFGEGDPSGSDINELISKQGEAT